MTVIIALDLGTTGNRAIAIDETGRIISSHYREFKQHYPHPGWVEHDPMEIWTTTRSVLNQAIADVGQSRINAIGITNQRETTVIWDRTSGLPVYNAIVWQCRRTAPRCSELKRHQTLIQSKTGLILDAYFSATKIEWILNQLPPHIDPKNLKFGTIDSWILDRLTNGAIHATDVSNASRTMLWNIHTQAYDPDLLDLFNISTSILPTVLPSNAEFGKMASTGIPITGILGDQQASLFSHSSRQRKIVKNTYGTGLFTMALCEAPTPIENCLTTVAWAIDDRIQYAREGSAFVGGSLIQWLRDGLGLIQNSYEIEALAKESGTANGLVIVPAFVGLGSPHWDSTAQGLIIGITRGTSKSNIAYAALEAIAFQSQEIINVVTDSMTSLRVDGGASKNDLLLQIQANQLGCPIERPTSIEGTAIGVALMAGIGAGLWAMDFLPEWVKIEKIFQPNGTNQTPMSRWNDAVTRAKGWTTLPLS